MFAAVLNGEGPLQVEALRAASPGCRIELVDTQGRVALLVSAEPGPGGEWRSIERLDGRLWIVGRIRLDGRRALAVRLEVDVAAVSDGRLCLEAYARWGEGFLDRLAGDFCFVVWDEARGMLLGARDQMGIRGLFYAETSPHTFVSDSLDWISRRPGFDRSLDDQWIGDFLCLGSSLDFDRTVWRGVHRLAPAHRLALTPTGRTLRRYWTLDVPEPLFLRSGVLYAERFRELVGQAITDRLPREGKVGVSMSGGLDSTTLAALAVERTGAAARVVADCVYHEWRMPDEEGRFSALAARHLGIALNLRPIDDLSFDADWRCRDIALPEPSTIAISAHGDRAMAREMAAVSPVWLYGEGPDNAFEFERGPYLSWLRRHGQWRRLAEALLLYAGAKSFRSWAGTVARYAVPSMPSDAPVLPVWLDPDFARAFDLDERLRAGQEFLDPSHPWHPVAMGAFKNPIWQKLFADRDQDEMTAPMVWRHPYFDLRVLQFMLSVPPVPWAREKRLMRIAMRDRLPRGILTRKKTPVARSLLVGPMQEKGLGTLAAGPHLDPYVDRRRIPATTDTDRVLRPLIAVHALDHWIMYNRRVSAEEAGSA